MAFNFSFERWINRTPNESMTSQSPWERGEISTSPTVIGILIDQSRVSSSRLRTSKCHWLVRESKIVNANWSVSGWWRIHQIPSCVAQVCGDIQRRTCLPEEISNEYSSTTVPYPIETNRRTVSWMSKMKNSKVKIKFIYSLVDFHQVKWKEILLENR